MTHTHRTLTQYRRMVLFGRAFQGVGFPLYRIHVWAFQTTHAQVLYASRQKIAENTVAPDPHTRTICGLNKLHPGLWVGAPEVRIIFSACENGIAMGLTISCNQMQSEIYLL
eukprot:GEMP01018852.1.p2 GENE.GEMP01018852.1~~GEMP01018852.1.p2  ORF type:complete len:112 (-),score=1.79 GEMP01018852.1:1466-1801(-)